MSGEFGAAVIVLFIFGGIIYCFIACCVGLKHMCRKKYPSIFHTATYESESSYSPNSRPFTTNVSNPMLESSQTRL